MKKLFLSILLLSSALGFNSCSEDFIVAAPYKDIAVVYGLLNMRDTAHYIRIQKAFLDENKSAIEMSKVADSNFYSQLDVKMKEISGATVVNTIQLQRVNMTQEGFTKDTGTFFNAPFYAYKFKQPLNPNYKYRLVMTHAGSGKVDSSEIDILDSSKLTVSSFGVLGGYKFSFTRTYPEAAAKYQLFVEAGTNAKYIEGIVRFHWVDSNLATAAQTDRFADFTFASKPVDNKPLEALNASFYTFLKDAMLPPPENIVRLMDSVDFFIYTGGQDYYNYVNTTQIQSGGLTAGQIKPTYTNIKGKDVFGIFSARNYRIKYGIPIDPGTIDSLKVHQITAALKIRGKAHH